MLKKILVGIGGAFALFLVVVLGVAVAKPDTFRIERKTTVAASPEAVYANIEDFRKWAAWSPWEKLDPKMRKVYGGPQRGTGSTYAWQGNDEVGEGKMTLTGATPARKVDIRLEFLKPFEATNRAEFTLAPAGPGTEVTWAMSGENKFVGKVFAVLVDMDAMLGADFEKGLAGLKRVSEAAPKAP